MAGTAVPGDLIPGQVRGDQTGAPRVLDQGDTRSFQQAAGATLELIRQTLGCDMVTMVRIFGTSMIRLVSSPHRGGIIALELDGEYQAALGVPGDPGNATRAMLEQAISEISQGTQLPGVVAARLLTREGDLLGLVLVLRSTPFPEDLELRAKELLITQSRVLSLLLEQEIQNVAEGRQRDAGAVNAFLDPFTKMPDRRAWGLLLRHEEQRAISVGHPAGVVVVDGGPSSSSRTLRKVVQTLQEHAGAAPALCRLTDRMWGVVVTGLDRRGMALFGENLAVNLRKAGGSPAVGVAMRGSGADLAQAWSLADERSFRARRSQRNVVVD